jgi:Formate hydrogenlyase subunit 6/NADH:ubiquinone oxidoreductase 23 kD subunit (chain I)
MFEIDKEFNDNKTIPILFDDKKDCCGCKACYFICPVNGKYMNKKENHLNQENSEHGAITMMKDERGFMYPLIDGSLCIRCHKCINVCPLK